MIDLLSFYKWAALTLLALGGSWKQVFRQLDFFFLKVLMVSETEAQTCKSHHKERKTQQVISETYKVVVPLNDLQEKRRPVLHGFGEDLKEVTFVVKIH